MRIAVAIPCYKVTQHVLGVIDAIGPEVERIYAVDDACPEGSGRFIEQSHRDPRVRVLYNPENRGVGGAVVTAYQAALATIAAHERTVLQPVDHEAFFAALDAPAAPTEALRAAVRRHRETVVSK